MLTVHIALLLLLVVGDVLAPVAPGDEHAECEVQVYTIRRIRVLLDSWRYQTLLADITILNDGLTEGKETFIVQIMVGGNVLSSASIIIASNSE